jgi:YgiT-type zinc finger domain-containing protein
MSRRYSDCIYCGGEVEEQLLPREIWWKNQLFVFENVPIGVCKRCGEKFLKPEVSKTIDRMLQETLEPIRTLAVPVYQYESETA